MAVARRHVMPSPLSTPSPKAIPFAARLIVYALLVLLPLLALTAYNLRRDLAQERADAVDRVRLISREIATEGEQALHRAERLLMFLASRSEVREGDAPRCNEFLRGQIALDPLLANIGLIDRHGKAICSALGVPVGVDDDFADSQAFLQARQGAGRLIGLPMRGRIGDWTLLPLTLTLSDGDGRFSGVIFVALNVSLLSQSWQRFALPEGSVLVMHNDEGRIVARYPDAQRWIGHDASEKLQDFMAAHPDGSGGDTGLDGVQRVFAISRMTAQRWSTLVELPATQVYAEAHRREREALLGVGGALALVLLLAAWLSRSLAHPLRDLQQAAAAVARGERERRANEMVPGEFREVAQEFNRMAEQLGRAELQLRRSNGFYAALSQVNKALVRGGDRQQLCSDVCAACVDAGHALIATLWLREGQHLHLFASAGPVLSLYGTRTVSQDFAEAPMSLTPTAEALRSGRPVVSNDYQNDPRTRPWHEQARQTGVRAMVAVPLTRRQAVEAVLVLHVAEPDWFDALLLKLLTELVGDLALGLEILDREAARAEAERQATQSREQFQRLFEAAPLPVAVFDQPALRLLAANPAYVDALGLPMAQIQGQTLQALGLAPSDVQRLQQRLREQRGRLRGFEASLRTGQGAVQELQINAEAIEYQGQSALLVVNVDLGPHKRNEQALRDSLSRFELAAATGHVWAWRPDAGLKPPEALLSALGYSDEQLGHQPGLWLPEVHEQDRAGLLEALQQHLQQRGPLRLEFRVRARDGSEHWLLVSGQGQWDEGGRLIQMAGVVFDVSAHHRSEQA